GGVGRCRPGERVAGGYPGTHGSVEPGNSCERASRGFAAAGAAAASGRLLDQPRFGVPPPRVAGAANGGRGRGIPGVLGPPGPARLNLGMALLDKGALDEAIAEFRAAIHIKKDYAGAHNSLGNALTAKGQLAQAIAEFQESLRLKKDVAGVHYNLGTALAAKG